MEQAPKQTPTNLPRLPLLTLRRRLEPPSGEQPIQHGRTHRIQPRVKPTRLSPSDTATRIRIPPFRAKEHAKTAVIQLRPPLQTLLHALLHRHKGRLHARRLEHAQHVRRIPLGRHPRPHDEQETIPPKKGRHQKAASRRRHVHRIRHAETVQIHHDQTPTPAGLSDERLIISPRHVHIRCGRESHIIRHAQQSARSRPQPHIPASMPIPHPMQHQTVSRVEKRTLRILAPIPIHQQSRHATSRSRLTQPASRHALPHPASRRSDKHDHAHIPQTARHHISNQPPVNNPHPPQLKHKRRHTQTQPPVRQGTTPNRHHAHPAPEHTPTLRRHAHIRARHAGEHNPTTRRGRKRLQHPRRIHARRTTRNGPPGGRQPRRPQISPQDATQARITHNHRKHGKPPNHNNRTVL